MYKVFIGIDNGVTGAIGVLSPKGSFWYPMPVWKALDYQKTKAKYVTRVDVNKLADILNEHVEKAQETIILLERPMVNPMRFEATKSALRALEATLITIEAMGIGLQYLDSKEWQSKYFPPIPKPPRRKKGEPKPVKDPKAKKEDNILKKYSLDFGQRLYPHLEFTNGDADAIFIAQYCREKFRG